MCGIWALINRQNFTSKHIASFEKVKPRGPDHSVLHLYPHHIIGHHFLALGTYTTKAEQPYFYHELEYNYTVMCNGEIYNHSQLRLKYDLKIESPTDCSIVLPLFKAINEDFAKLNRELIGQYAIFITKQHIKSGVVDYYLSVDDFSVIPAFYFCTHSQFGCSSLLAGLSDLSQDVRRLDQGSLIQGRYTPQTNTNEIIQSKRYTIQFPVIYEEENVELYQEIVNTLKKTVESRLLFNQPIGCLLSGGLDSSLIASIASNALKKKGLQLFTFSVGMKDSIDLKYARKVAQYIGSQHTQYYFQPEEALKLLNDAISTSESFDPTTIGRTIIQYFMAEKISKETGIKVILTGDGADECQMGHLHFYLAPSAEQARKVRNQHLSEVHLYNGLSVERAFSHFAIEVRTPYLDSRFANLYQIIDPKLLIPKEERFEKYLIKRSFEYVWPEILPEFIFKRKKIELSEGISEKDKNWVKILKNHIQANLFPNLLGEQEPIYTVHPNIKFEGVQPLTGEAQYIRMIHSKTFNDNHEMLSHYWCSEPTI